MSDVRHYVIQRCPECHGQAHETSAIHFNDCPNRSRIFVPEVVLVPWPRAASGSQEGPR